MSDWISVEDRLPDESDMLKRSDGHGSDYWAVLYYGIKPDYGDCKPNLTKDYHTSGWYSPETTRGQISRFATHWMPLPEPPVKE